MLWAICYDISNTRRRAKLAKVLEDYGRRVQRSVFECRLEADTLDRLQRRIQQLELAQEDLIRYYPFCQACAHRIQHKGGPAPEPEARDLIF